MPARDTGLTSKDELLSIELARVEQGVAANDENNTAHDERIPRCERLEAGSVR